MDEALGVEEKYVYFILVLVWTIPKSNRTFTVFQFQSDQSQTFEIDDDATGNLGMLITSGNVSSLRY